MHLAITYHPYINHLHFSVPFIKLQTQDVGVLIIRQVVMAFSNLRYANVDDPNMDTNSLALRLYV